MASLTHRTSYNFKIICSFWRRKQLHIWNEMRNLDQKHSSAWQSECAACTMNAWNCHRKTLFYVSNSVMNWKGGEHENNSIESILSFIDFIFWKNPTLSSFEFKDKNKWTSWTTFMWQSMIIEQTQNWNTQYYRIFNVKFELRTSSCNTYETAAISQALSLW